MLHGRTIHLCVSGGIAAYKAVELARALQRAGAEVRVAMTPNARSFVGPLTFQAITRHPVLTTTLDPSEEMQIGHIAFAQACDALVVAPATANLIGKAANGLGDEIVSTVLLATDAPVVVAPAMNTRMWENPAVQLNLSRLRARGWAIVEPDAGELACGHVGPGRLPDAAVILDAVERLLAPGALTGRRVLVSAGPTREHFDPVRFLGNPSSGKTGFAVAAAAARAGAHVTLVHGPVSLTPPAGIEAVPVTSAREMHAAMLARADGADAVVMTAAVADWRPAEVSAAKRKKAGDEWTVRMVRNPDILADLGARRAEAGASRPVLVGFAAETGDPVPAARGKLAAKRVDLVVANDVSAPGAGFAGDDNRVWLVEPDGVDALPMMAKAAIGEVLVRWLSARFDRAGGEGG